MSERPAVPVSASQRPAPSAPSRRRATLSAALAGFLLGVAVDRALPHGSAAEERAPRPRRELPGVRRVTLPPTLLARAGVRTLPVERRSLVQAVELVGAVDFDGDRVADVGSRVAGRVARMTVSPGAAVSAGDVLAEVESAAVGEAAAAYLTAQAHAAAARAEALRLSTLEQQHLATAREIEQNRAHLAEHEAEARGAAQRLLAMGLAPGELRGLGATTRLHRITLRAPIAGRVVARPAVLGQVVEPTASLFRIADPTRLWVQLEVFERDLARVRVGDGAEITSEAWPGRVFRGVVGHVAASVTPETRTARVRIALGNDDEALRPGQFVTARVRPATERGRSALVAPRSAIVQLEGRPAAFVAVREGVFELRTLDLGALDGDAFEVARGLDEGEPLVVAGAFALKSELQR